MKALRKEIVLRFSEAYPHFFKKSTDLFGASPTRVEIAARKAGSKRAHCRQAPVSRKIHSATECFSAVCPGIFLRIHCKSKAAYPNALLGVDKRRCDESV